MNINGRRNKLIRALVQASDRPCMATGDAIVRLAAEFRDGLRGLLDFLVRDPESMVYLAGGSAGNAWLDDRTLALVFGRSDIFKGSFGEED